MRTNLISALRNGLVDSIAAYLQMRYISHLYIVIVKLIQHVDKRDNRYQQGEDEGERHGNEKKEKRQDMRMAR